MNETFTHATDTPRSFDALTLDALSDAELDTLGIGVVGLQPDGLIRRYNLYESRLARLDRAQVVGRNFFTEVARCTRGDAFEGRFRRLLQTGGARSDRFSFVFDFTFGAQEVKVEMVRPRRDGLVYVLIARTRATGVREEFPNELRAVEQRVLAPHEPAQGVLRDDLEGRVLSVPWSFLASLRATCEHLAPETWTLFCHEWGVQWGRRLAVDLETSAIERHGKGLRELSMREAATMLSARLRQEGWGRLALDFELAPDGLVVARLARSAVAESARLTSPAVQVGGGRSCHLLAGCLGAVLTHLGERRLAVLELSCSAMPGHDGEPCVFAAFAARRRGQVEEAVASGVTTPEALIEALRGEQRS